MEKEKIERLVSCGDRGSCKELFELFYRRTFAAVVALTRNRDAAEDIVQDAFIRAFNQMGNLRDPSKFGPWVAAIATNLARDLFKREKRIILAEEPLDRSNQDPGLSPEEQVIRREQSEKVRAALRQLPPDQYQAIILQYYYDLKMEEVAGFIGTSTGTVKSRLHRARRKLQKILREGEPEGHFERHLDREEGGDQH